MLHQYHNPTRRQHRKRLALLLEWRHLRSGSLSLRALVTDLNTWIGLVFAIGATLFAVACLAALVPGTVPEEMRPEGAINRTFFLGSIPFTTAAFLQLLQAELAGEYAQQGQTGRSLWLGWRAADRGWLACAYQFCGTLLFNVNTYDALHAPDSWLLEDIEIWVPNLLGCIAFMMAALFAAYTPQPMSFDAAGYALVFTLVGAVCFLLGALLLMVEAVVDKAKPHDP
jgi:hypothetical protein